MDRQAFRDEVIFRLTGGILDIELDGASIDKLLNAAFREVQRYIDTTKIITVPYKYCLDFNDKKYLDFTDCNVSSVVSVYRSDGFTGNPTLAAAGGGMVDPMLASQWQLMTGTGSLYNFSNYVFNYASWNTLLQIRNTTSTDLAWKYDKSTNRLYINIASNVPKAITVEFIPRFNDISEIVSDYWIDILVRMAVAIGKVTLGRIRTRYTQSNALWQQDGATILGEGTAELTELRSQLKADHNLFYPID